MKSKTPLALIELVIMLLVFALAAALCLQAFSWADRASARNVLTDEALIQIQSVAELTKHYAGGLRTAADDYGGSWDGSVWTIPGEDFRVEVIPKESPVPLLGTADVLAVTNEEDTLATLTVCWQEVAADG